MDNKRDSQSLEEIQNWTMVFPNQANPNGNMFGGDLLAIMDTTAAMAAKRFCQMDISTISVEAVHFAKPCFVGDNLKTTAKVIGVGQTSMMVKAESYRDIGENRLEKCVSAFFTLVAFDKDRQLAQVPTLDHSQIKKSDRQLARIVKESAKQRNFLINEI